ncbi:hypothetical protein ISG33_02070 [Glaciecola sp. MH2013]|uniref:hypothetical protein n=1 Tax=Glaciecola sp. MH2013 TaxID=2785524 RepID=UPI00189E7B81|nr:hypothetical protein [Glaciecola sp. MH2013]MBF7072188.1 hypothetical protein [Glaciecola sp. MH2013]
MKTKYLLIGISSLIVAIFFSANASAQEACNWYGRDVVPLCKNKAEGWGRESGQRCISRNACLNDQPSNRGGIIGSNPDGGSGGGGSGGGSNGGDSGGPFDGPDQCNTTAQCQAMFGSAATDCADSRSNASICICGSQRCDATGGGSGGGSGSGNFSNVAQPPSSCSNANLDMRSDFKLHTILDRNTSRSDFGDYTNWYTEQGNMQRFQLKDGDQNQTSSILRPRVETHQSPRWKRSNQSSWREFSANYYLADWDEGQLYAIFQIKTNDASNFIIQALIDRDGSLKIARRGKGRVKIADDVYQKPFNLRVRSNGFRVEVYLNCDRVLAENHPQPNLESNSTLYGWRWGLYRQQADDDKHDGTTTMFVTGVNYE